MKRYAILFALVFIVSLAVPAVLTFAQENVTLTIAVVNNPDQRKLLELSDKFQAQHPTIKLSFVMLPENELRDRVTTDISTKAGSFDIVQIGTYETPVWGKNGWLASVDDLMQQYPDNAQPNYDVNDLIKGIRLGLSDGGKLYAVPFYGESSMLFYNKKMFAAAGLKMPAEPTWDQVREFAKKLHNPAKKQYGIALRGLPGWGEILAPLDTVINTWGGKWFDQDWQPQLTAPEFKDAVSFYVQLLKDYVNLVGRTYGWATIPPGTRYSTYKNANYLKAAKDFAAVTLKSIESADPTDATRDPVPYTGVQFVGIPEFQGFGTDVSKEISAAIAGTQTVDQALETSQDIVTKAMTDAGYLK